MKALKARCDWLLKPRISFAIHLREKRAGFASENIRIVAEINELCAMSLAN